MPTLTGKRLGPYEILSAIGAGGMGEVYQAHDTKLGRDVAIKVLPEAFAHDPERLTRFQREAKMLAALNHPNIATIYGLEQSNGTSYLVMELVSGETLADRVKREGALPVEEALAICKQIADALEAAHEKGIIHRDLKPANVKVTPEGKVKVLDFGLAKAFEGNGPNDDPSNSPTLSMAATMDGVLLGTAAYMSPEQARGKAVDHRADIWAFGCVLYEMLTGKQAFQGTDVTEILAAIVKTEPNFDALPAETPQAIRNLLCRCLEKEPRGRLLRITLQRRVPNDYDHLPHLADRLPSSSFDLGLACHRNAAQARSLLERLPGAPRYLLAYDFSLLGCENQQPKVNGLQILAIPIASHNSYLGVGLDVQQHVAKFVGNRMAQDLRCSDRINSMSEIVSRSFAACQFLGKGLYSVVEDIDHVPVGSRAGSKSHHFVRKVEDRGHGGGQNVELDVGESKRTVVKRTALIIF